MWPAVVKTQKTRRKSYLGAEIRKFLRPSSRGIRGNDDATCEAGHFRDIPKRHFYGHRKSSAIYENNVSARCANSYLLLSTHVPRDPLILGVLSLMTNEGARSGFEMETRWKLKPMSLLPPHAACSVPQIHKAPLQLCLSVTVKRQSPI